jgi:hypothetical protein
VAVGVERSWLVDEYRACRRSIECVVRTLHLEPWAGRWVAIDLDDQVQLDAVLLDDLMTLLRLTGRDVSASFGLRILMSR